jgi:hypothetical protein
MGLNRAIKLAYAILVVLAITFTLDSCVEKERQGPIRGGSNTSKSLESQLEEAIESVETAIDAADARLNETITRTDGEPEVQGTTGGTEEPNYDHIPKLDRQQYRLSKNTLITVVTIDGCEYILVEPLSKWTAVSVVHKQNCQYHY